jgi:hypothetical protein
MKLRAFVLVIAITASLGCVKSGSVVEKQPVASLAAYKSATISVEAPADMKNVEQHKSGFVSALTARLKDKKIFMEVPPEGGDVSIKVTITKMDAGSTAMQALGNANNGAAEVTATVELFEKGSKSVGAFEVTGNSKKNSQVSINGVNTAAMEDSTRKAIDAAADEIALYLEKKR